MSIPGIEPVAAAAALSASFRALRASAHIMRAKKPRTATRIPSSAAAAPARPLSCLSGLPAYPALLMALLLGSAHRCRAGFRSMSIT